MKPSLLRLAAIKLATLHPSDRRWLLDRLETNERNLLAPLVDAVMQIAQGDRHVLEQALGSGRNAMVPKASEPDGIASQWPALARKDLPPKLADALREASSGRRFAELVQQAAPAQVERVG